MIEPELLAAIKAVLRLALFVEGVLCIYLAISAKHKYEMEIYALAAVVLLLASTG